MMDQLMSVILSFIIRHNNLGNGNNPPPSEGPRRTFPLWAWSGAAFRSRSVGWNSKVRVRPEVPGRCLLDCRGRVTNLDQHPKHSSHTVGNNKLYFIMILSPILLDYLRDIHRTTSSLPSCLARLREYISIERRWNLESHLRFRDTNDCQKI
ncbi:hypothetical protein BO86DRAFT_82571 [Aspergillus japonicus CBS 114.51]|uniref:Uncharacterized protein n=1 Tax=Aspergillus japonicus CBS 114.51 TaxID=1448312 RepID=A0A8T8X355_ASPJA|nr:hypothetical protein BO86DRAFT_82571 [Aspergillus japonicus CBS 114.51]RAH82360.1 hypothetical protein BO86DRAFT_82571 [Aspergillus japonicus CBS 114.51]